MKIHYFVYIIYTIFVLFIGRVSYVFGKMNMVCNHDIHHYKVVEYKLEREEEFSSALESSLQWYMKNDSVLWNSSFVSTEEYHRIQSLVYENSESTDTIN